jgi:hypothetical protein
MPYKIKIKGGRYCVIVRDTGKTKKCYPDKESAQDYATVLNMRHAGIPPKKGKSKKDKE